MGIRLARSIAATLEAAQWYLDGRRVVVCCPICAATIGLDGRHVIARDGAVTPALSCGFCPFLDWVHLTGYGDDECIGCARAARNPELTCAFHGKP